jgi:hypothetical protein
MLKTPAGTTEADRSALIEVAGRVPLSGLGLSLPKVSLEGISRDALNAALNARTRPPAIDVGIDFRTHRGLADLIDLEVVYFDFDFHAEIQADKDGLPPLTSELLPDYGTVRAHLPRFRSPGVDGDWIHLSHLFQFLAYATRKGVRLRRPADPGAVNCGWPDPVHGRTPPRGAPVTRQTISDLLVRFPKAAEQFSKELDRLFGGGWECADPQLASAAAMEFFGIPIDLEIGGRLIPPDEVISILELAYAGYYPEEIEKFVADEVPTVRALHVRRRRGGGVATEVAGAVWSYALEPALEGPEYFDTWREAQRSPAPIAPDQVRNAPMVQLREANASLTERGAERDGGAGTRLEEEMRDFLAADPRGMARA